MPFFPSSKLWQQDNILFEKGKDFDGTFLESLPIQPVFGSQGFIVSNRIDMSHQEGLALDEGLSIENKKRREKNKDMSDPAVFAHAQLE